MKISPEDPILTAYALGELDLSSRRNVEAAFAADDSLAQEGAALSSLAGLLSETLRGETHSLGAARHEEILKSGRRPDADVLILDHRRRSRRQSLIAVVGVAAVVVAGFVGLSRLETAGPSASGSSDAASAGGKSGDVAEVDGSPNQSSLLKGVVVQGSGNSQVLPLDVKPVDPSFVERSIAETGTLPLAEHFKIESWVNAGALTSSPLLTVGNVDAYIELGPCPWDEGQALLLVNLRSTEGNESSVKATVNFNPERVKSALLLGSFDATDAAAPQAGLIRSAQTSLYQIELHPGFELVGSLDLKVEDHTAGYLPLPIMPRAEMALSNDFALVRLFAEFAKWGASDSRDPERLRQLAVTTRALLSEVTDEKTRYALDMILLSEEALKK